MPNRSSNRAPEWPFRINNASPQARGLVAWWPHMRGFSRDLLTREIAIHSPFDEQDKIGVTGRWGPVCQLTAINSHCVVLLGSSALIPTQGCTMIMHARYTETPDSSFTIGVNAGTAGERCEAAIFGTDVLFDFGGTSEGSTRLTASSVTFTTDPSVWMFTAGSRGMEIWRDGKVLASNAANPSRSSSISAFQLGKTTSNAKIEYGDVRLYNYQLSMRLCYELWAPQTRWDLYRPEVPASVLARSVVASRDDAKLIFRAA